MERPNDSRTAAGRQKDIEAIVPLTPMQQGMLFHSLYNPESGAYFLQMRCTLEGDLDPAAFAQAWQRLTGRHGALRTAFVWQRREGAYQVVWRQVRVPWEELDWRDAAPGEQEEWEERRLAEDRRRGFDLAKAPLLRLALIRLAERRWRLIWSFHHLLLDGWSMARVLAEVTADYGRLRRGLSAVLPAPRPFREYVAWLQAQSPAEAEAYWRERLAGLDGVSSPAGRPLPVVPAAAPEYGELRWSLAEGETRALAGLAEAARVTLGTAVLGAWCVLLARVTGREDVTVGLTVSGRPPGLPGVEEMVGMFVNTLPLRVEVDESAPALSWLRQVQERMLEVQRYSYAALPDVQRWAGVEPGAPLFDHLFVFENYPVSEAAEEVNGLRVSAVESFEPTDYPLTVLVLPGAELTVQLTWDRLRFPEESAQGVARWLRQLLLALPECPDEPLFRRDMLAPEERRQVLLGWNDTAARFDASPFPHRLFEEQADRTPEAPALDFGGMSLTCRELEERANRLAWHLVGLGVRPDDRVGIFLERSPEMAVAVLAILKAGGAYVPLDPSYPADRLAFMAADARLRALVTSRNLAGRAPADGTRLVRLDAEAAEIAARPSSRPSVALDPENLLYVVYTSGSTGRPKGIALSHGALGNLILWHRAALPPRPGFLQFASLSFDASFHEMFAAWCTGGCVYLISEELRHDLDALALDVAARPIDRVILPVVVLQRWAAVHAADPALFGRLREVITTGEALQITPPVAELFEGLPAASLHNHYGPAETHVVTALTLAGPPRSWPADPPVGKPVANTRCYVLDRWLRPAPAGVAAELYLAGANLARGYLDRPDLTAARFVPDPFAPEPGGRLYRTGDQACWRPDGDLDYLGRLDHMVKIRGFRVELGEVEAALGEHPAVRSCAVQLRQDAPGGKRLVAYVVAAAGSVLDPAALRAHLAARLPDFMVPALFVPLAELPLTANGKVDRRALPASGDVVAPPALASFVPPRDPVEEVLADIWAEVLGLERAGIRDDFFAHGGHSLLAVQALARARAALGVAPPLKALFDARTPEAFAAVVRREKALGEPAPPQSAIPPRPAGEPAPLSFAQERMWVLDRLQPAAAAYNLPGWLRLAGPLDPAALDRALAEVVRRHSVLRSRVLPGDGRPVQTVLPAGHLTVPRVDLSALPEAAAVAREIGRAELARPFDLEREAPLRLSLLRLGPEEHVLSLTLHHVAADGTSIPVFLRELAALYGAFAGGRLSPLPEPPLQYADFAAWQREEGFAAGQLEYWREKLADLEPLALPLDRPRPAVGSYRGGTVPLDLPPQLSAAVEAQARRCGATPFLVGLAAFLELLARLAGRTDVAAGVPVAGRDRVELEGLIGPFLNTLALRVDTAGRLTVKAFLERVREEALAAFAHRDVPFERVVVALRPERDPSRTPLVQVMFDLHAWEEEPVTAAGLTLELGEVENAATKFDLTLTLERRGGFLRGTLEHDAGLFELATAARFAAAYVRLLAGMAGDPQAAVEALPWMSEEERRQVEAWSRPDSPQSAAASILPRLEARMRDRPSAPAVVDAAGTLTYGELDRRTRAVAQALRAHGAGPESVVAVCLDRSRELVVAVLGILRAGAAYLPLDPAHPPRRLALLLRDAGARLGLTAAGRLPSPDVRWLDVAALAGEAAAAPLVPPDPGHLAYVLYTSGSTGEPKGCLIEHAALASYLAWADRFYFGDRDAGDFALFSPLTFDLTVTSLFLPLLRGRTLRVVDPEADPADLPRLALERVDAVKLTPSHLSLLAQGEAAAPRLEVAVVGGEALSREQVAALERAAPGARIYNEYGPTEATVGCVVWRVTAADERIRIGRPVDHAEARVLDAGMRPSPPGVPGELWIGGAGLARGYLGRPGLTAERFVPDPAAARPGERLYRTGDRARWLPDGTLEGLGRVDEQLKVRGIRVEPREIETALESYPGVCRAVVILRQDGEGAGEGREMDQRLVAYVEAPAEAGPEALRHHLESLLPLPLVPSAFVRLEALPLTAHGKVDRRALPRPDRAAATRSEAAPPRNPDEALLAAIWAELLRLEEVGIHDNFFELGGDSILALQVASRAARHGLALPAAALFHHPTVARLAAAATRQPAAASEQGPVEGGLIPTPIQRWFFELDVPNPAHFVQALLLGLRPGVDSARLQRALEALRHHHDALRMTARRKAGEPGWDLALPADGPPWLLARVDLAPRAPGEAAAEVERRCAEAVAGIDLERGPAAVAVLFHEGEGRESRLLLAIHHLAVDGVSWRLLLEDLEAAYLQGEAALPPKTTSVREWGRRLAERAASPEILAELPWWESTGALGRGADLPPDFPGAPDLTGDEATVTVRLDPAATAELVTAVPRTYNARVDDVLLAALLAALCQGQGRRGLRIDLEGHGRAHLAADLDLRRTVGWFTALYPVWLELPRSAAPGDLLKAVKEQLRAVPGEGLGYGLLRYLHPDPAVRGRLALPPDAPASPLLFNYHGSLDAGLPAGGLFTAAAEAGPNKDPASRRSHRIEVGAGLTGGCLEVHWTYGRRLYRAETVERWAADHLAAVRRLVRHCQEPEAGGLTPSDIPEAGLSEAELRDLEAELFA